MKYLLILLVLCSSFVFAEERVTIEIKKVEIVVKEYLDEQYKVIVPTKDIKQWLEKHKDDFINGIYPNYDENLKAFDGYIVYYQKKNPNPVTIFINGRKLTPEEAKEYLEKAKK